MARTQLRVSRAFFRGCRSFGCIMVALASGPLGALAHEATRAAHESSLNPQEKNRLLAAAGLRAATSSPAPAAETARLTLSLVDSETRQPLPGLVRILQADGTTVPLPGLVNRGIKLRANHPAKDWYALTEPTAIPLPRGRLTIEAFSGLETELAQTTVDLSKQAADRVELAVKAFSRASQNGWYGGNTHLHLNSLTREQADEYLRTLPRSDRLDLIFVSHLERVKDDLTYITNEYSRIDLERLGGAHLHFGNGQEHRHNFERNSEGYGHVMLLNIRQLVRPVSIGPMIRGVGPDWPPLQQGIKESRRDGSTVIWCHNRLGYEDVPAWLGGLVAAQNIFDGGSHGSYADSFYRYLDIGLKVPFSTGTDWFIYDFSRAYVRLSGALSVPNWLADLAAGRSFITNGPLLTFRVGASEMGDTLRLAGAARVPVSGSAKGRHDFNALEVVHNGKVVHRAATRAVGGHFEANVDLSLSIDEPGWIALRIPGGSLDSTGAVVVPPTLPVRGSGPKNEMGEVLFAHTSAVYVEFAGKRIFRRTAAESLVADLEGALRSIPPKAKFDTDAQREDVLQVYRDGLQVLRGRMAENEAR